MSFPHLIHAIMSLTSGAIFFAVAVLLVSPPHQTQQPAVTVTPSLMLGPCTAVLEASATYLCYFQALLTRRDIPAGK